MEISVRILHTVEIQVMLTDADALAYVWATVDVARREAILATLKGKV